jgi:hypothetical protein
VALICFLSSCTTMEFQLPRLSVCWFPFLEDIALLSSQTATLVSDSCRTGRGFVTFGCSSTKGYSELLQLASSLFRDNEALEVRLDAAECLRYSCVEGKRKNVQVSDDGYDG